MMGMFLAFLIGLGLGFLITITFWVVPLADKLDSYRDTHRRMLLEQLTNEEIHHTPYIYELKNGHKKVRSDARNL